MYIFFPIGWMYYFGTNLDQRFAVPDFWPKKDETNTIPFEREEIGEELERLRARRLEARRRRLIAEGRADELGEGQGETKSSAVLKSLGRAGVEGGREQLQTLPQQQQQEVKEQGAKSWYKFW